MVLKAELQKTLSALSAGRAKHSRSFGWSAGGRGHPPRPAALSGRSAGPGRGVHRGRARPPIAGPFLARHPGTRPLSPGRCPRRHPSPPPRPRQLCPGLASPLSSTQKLQARRLLNTAPIFPARRALATLTGDRRPGDARARSRGGRRSGGSARSCFPRPGGEDREEERKGRTSGL